jgi:hypothetical protein
MDLTGTLNYYGSADSNLIEKDFSDSVLDDFTIRKQILWKSTDATDKEVGMIETKTILEYGSNNPEIGYNQRPIFRSKNKE